jgi:hypothetical protein
MAFVNENKLDCSAMVNNLYTIYGIKLFDKYLISGISGSPSHFIPESPPLLRVTQLEKEISEVKRNYVDCVNEWISKSSRIVDRLIKLSKMQEKFSVQESKDMYTDVELTISRAFNFFSELQQKQELKPTDPKEIEAETRFFQACFKMRFKEAIQDKKPESIAIIMQNASEKWSEYTLAERQRWLNGFKKSGKSTIDDFIGPVLNPM